MIQCFEGMCRLLEGLLLKSGCVLSTKGLFDPPKLGMFGARDISKWMNSGEGSPYLFRGGWRACFQEGQLRLFQM